MRSEIAAQLGFTVIEFFLVLVIVCIFVLVFIAPYYFCPQQWAKSGLSAEYYFGTGCMVKRKDGTIVPAKAIRDVSL